MIKIIKLVFAMIICLPFLIASSCPSGSECREDGCTNEYYIKFHTLFEGQEYTSFKKFCDAPDLQIEVKTNAIQKDLVNIEAPYNSPVFGEDVCPEDLQYLPFVKLKGQSKFITMEVDISFQFFLQQMYYSDYPNFTNTTECVGYRVLNTEPYVNVILPCGGVNIILPTMIVKLSDGTLYVPGDCPC
jgi:hypothetical protein